MATGFLKTQTTSLPIFIINIFLKFSPNVTFLKIFYESRHDTPRQHIKKQRYYFADKGPFSQSCGFSSSRVDVRVGP